MHFLLLTTITPARLKLLCVIMWIWEDGLATLTATVRAVSDEEAVRHYARFMRVADTSEREVACQRQVSRSKL